jgi:CelD/BcsL family acetyltransferase involved in cellulose biosynthesis
LANILKNSKESTRALGINKNTDPAASPRRINIYHSSRSFCSKQKGGGGKKRKEKKRKEKKKKKEQRTLERSIRKTDAPTIATRARENNSDR